MCRRQWVSHCDWGYRVSRVRRRFFSTLPSAQEKPKRLAVKAAGQEYIDFSSRSNGDYSKNGFKRNRTLGSMGGVDSGQWVDRIKIVEIALVVAPVVARCVKLQISWIHRMLSRIAHDWKCSSRILLPWLSPSAFVPARSWNREVRWRLANGYFCFPCVNAVYTVLSLTGANSYLETVFLETYPCNSATETHDATESANATWQHTPFLHVMQAKRSLWMSSRILQPIQKHARGVKHINNGTPSVSVNFSWGGSSRRSGATTKQGACNYTYQREANAAIDQELSSTEGLGPSKLMTNRILRPHMSTWARFQGRDDINVYM